MATERAEAAAAGAACCLRMASKTSPGFEMCERSILVFIASSLSARIALAAFAEIGTSPPERK
jgi:hypothetical protein